MQRILISPGHTCSDSPGFITMVMIITRSMFPPYLRLSVPGASDWLAGSAPQPIRGGKQMMKLITHTRLISILVLKKQSESEECNNYYQENTKRVLVFSCENAALQVLKCSVCLSVCLCVCVSAS